MLYGSDVERIGFTSIGMDKYPKIVPGEKKKKVTNKFIEKDTDYVTFLSAQYNTTHIHF